MNYSKDGEVSACTFSSPKVVIRSTAADFRSLNSEIRPQDN